MPLVKGMLHWELEGCHWLRGCYTRGEESWRGAAGQGDVTLGERRVGGGLLVGGMLHEKGMVLKSIEGRYRSGGMLLVWVLLHGGEGDALAGILHGLGR